MKKKLILLTIVAAALLLTSCGGGNTPAANDTAQGGDQISAIYTQAAETLQAGISLTEAAKPLATNTPMSSPTPVILASNTPLVVSSPTPFPTLAPLASPTPFPTQNTSNNTTGGRPCLRAELLFEQPIDGWVLRPGESFVKEWRFANSGSCTWMGDYRLVLTDGTNFADATIYNLIDISDITDVGVPNGNKLIIKMSFQAPDAPGHYTGYYMLADPTGLLFGVGSLGNERFWVDIIVRN